MATSPNYGWSEPDNTSLVKDGAQAMRTLGDAIDTSVWNVGFGQAGKNKIINGDFGIWQRGTSFTGIASNGFTADRWKNLFINGVCNVSQQTFTPGTAPVSGYEGTFFYRFQRTSTHASIPDYWGQAIENVRTFANQTVTVSFWAKGSTTFNLDIYLEQNFGTGGSGGVATGGTTFTLTTSWQRFSQTYTVPSVNGKTIGTNSFLALVYRLLTNQGNVTVDLWGVQLEAGSKATPFQTASGGSIQGELAMCQRYFNRLVSGTNTAVGTLQAIATVAAIGTRSFPTMRTAPVVTISSPTHYTLRSATNTTLGGTVFNCFNINSQAASPYFEVASGLVAGNATECFSSNASATFDLSAEL